MAWWRIDVTIIFLIDQFRFGKRYWIKIETVFVRY